MNHTTDNPNGLPKFLSDRPACQILSIDGGYRVGNVTEAVAFIQSGPHRSDDEASALADRIARDADSYLGALNEIGGIVGVFDLRGLTLPAA